MILGLLSNISIFSQLCKRCNTGPLPCLICEGVVECSCHGEGIANNWSICDICYQGIQKTFWYIQRDVAVLIEYISSVPQDQRKGLISY